MSGVAGVPSGPLSTVTVPAPTNTGTQPLSFAATIAGHRSLVAIRMRRPVRRGVRVRAALDAAAIPTWSGPRGSG